MEAKGVVPVKNDSSLMTIILSIHALCHSEGISPKNLAKENCEDPSQRFG